MKQERICEVCGSVIPLDSPGGACMTCALKTAFTDVDDFEGRTIGNYTIIEQIGRGGFGVVYLAGQSVPVRRHVALKILSRNSVDERLKGQFVAEQQALALMSHPNIAKIFDAGETEWGMPYFVMELIEGEPITSYCDRKKLTPRERIEIFRQVCSGVQHAHQKAIIHRDLKPANILVEEIDDRPVPKIIDFGVAKAMGAPLADLSFHLEAGRVFGTPEYMPPEQARGDSDIDTRADIYSLGVLLYELLIGAPPFSRKELEQAGLEAILNKIENEDPPSPSARLSSMEEQVTIVADDRHIAPSQLRRMVRGDLDWIVMKALEKPRKRRYDSAGAFAIDIDCYLDDRPLPSRRGTLAYRLRKYVRRNRLMVSAVGCIALVILSAALIGYYLNRQNAREQADALLDTLANSRVERLPSVLADLHPLRHLTRERLEELGQDPKIETRARAQLALIQQGAAPVSTVEEFLLKAQPDELSIYLALLEDHKAALSPAAWTAMEDEELDPQQRLNASAICATFTPEDPRWGGLGEKVAGWMVSSGSVTDPRWVSLFKPVAVSLVAPLRRIYQDENVSNPRATAAAALAAYLQNDRGEMLGLLETARGPLQLAAITRVLARNPDTRQLLADEAQRPLPLLADEEAQRAAAQKRARLGLALLELGQADQAWPLFQHSPDPETRTQFIHGLADYAIDPELLISQLEEETDPGIISAILISLDEFDIASIPQPRREAMRQTLESYYTSAADAGVRSSAEWLMRRWGIADNLAQLDQPLLGKAPADGRNWYLTKGGDFTMVLLPTPVTGFEMGAPKTEENRQDNEGPVAVDINRRVAIATKEITVEQFMRFAKEMDIEQVKKKNPKDEADQWDGLDPKHPTPDSAMCGISLKQAALFCWWLTKQEGLDDQQCYLFEGDKFKDANPVVVEGYLDKGGYRLPTEAEWELACRGGTTGARYFGTAPDLLSKYARYRDSSLREGSRPAGSLRPNPFGLFDTLGNVTEWCQDRYWETYRPDMAGGSFEIEESWKTRVPSPDGQQYTYRGGSYLHPPRYVRSGWRNSTNYPNHPFTGFRIARTIQNP